MNDDVVTAAKRCLTELFPNKVSIQQSPYEADVQCAHAVISGQADCAVTVDGDLILYGCPWVVREPQSIKNGQYEQIHLSDVLGSPVSDDEPEVKWTLPLLQVGSRAPLTLCMLTTTQEYGVLLGCDYTGHNPGITPLRALELVQNKVFDFNTSVRQRFPQLADAQFSLMQLARLTYR